ncbi:ChaN family lipoprotein [Chelatococcus reniformis]|uniref:Haem-binding uptake Tiki superfamily ChaN domain-containing protein n=1 Tax=Chelatococcus reniformis TaxID=1494448 RepID=A0A916UGN1_9HYPH|nr:ChaN family lipoprotein [Chelatococcus reniformis]GGC71968.1 hypothetical protein GCM10010994_33010 [Chelatococcus reniformis]
MSAADAPAVPISHPRATWLDPTSGELRPQVDVLAEMAAKQVVLLGETHDIAEIHRWQTHVAAFLHVLRPRMAIGFEMFPRRLQPVLDRWVDGALGTAEFLLQSEWDTVWGFPPEIYLPLFHFCRQQGVRMLALNCHRPLVTRVGVEGWEAIPEEDRDGLTPAAPATAAYRRYLFGLGGAVPARFGSGPDDPAFARFWRAQQCWDRAFACNIARALAEDPSLLVVGIIGRGHLEFGHGTPYQLADLGIADVGVLLPNAQPAVDRDRGRGIANALFRIDCPEPPAERRKRDLPAAREP